MVNVGSLSLPEILLSAQQALQILSAYPFHWLGFFLIFLFCVESLMFIPRVGFTLKAAVAAVMGAQMFALFHEAARGQAPQLATLFQAFTMPASSQGLLIASTWFMLAAGYAAIWQMEGWKSVRFFFGNIRRDKPPSEAAILRFKLVALIVGNLFVFIAPAVVLANLPPGEALSVAVKAAILNLPLLGMLTAISVGFEYLMAYLSRSGRLGVVLSILLLCLYLPITFAFSYAAAHRILGLSAL